MPRTKLNVRAKEILSFYNDLNRVSEAIDATINRVASCVYEGAAEPLKEAQERINLAMFSISKAKGIIDAIDMGKSQ